MSGMARLLLSGEKFGSIARDPRGRWIFALTLVLVTLAELAFAYRHSDFNNDDLDHFALAAKSSLLAYMGTPVETIHIVPFHRLLTFLIFHLAPMNFKVALGLLGVVHGVTLYYLCRISRLFHAGIFGSAIVLCYALSVLNVFLFVWWASAAHRIPYLALSACATYHYLASLREDATRRDAVITIIAFLVGCGFYIKMVLLPFYLAVYGLAATGFAIGKWRRTLRLPICLTGGSVVYFVAYSYFVHPGHAGIFLALQIDGEYLLALLGNLIGFTLDTEFIQVAGLFNEWTIGVISVWLGMILFTTWRDKRVVIYWLLLISILFMDFLPIARSDRSLFFANIVPYSVRYHADAPVIVAVMLLIIAATLAQHEVLVRRRKRVILAICTVSLYTVAMVMNLRSESNHRALMFSTFSHAYMHNLRKGLKKIHEAQSSFVITPVPKGMDWAGDVTTSDRLVHLFWPEAKFDPMHGDYRVLEDGQVVSTEVK